MLNLHVHRKMQITFVMFAQNLGFCTKKATRSFCAFEPLFCILFTEASLAGLVAWVLDDELLECSREFGFVLFLCALGISAG